MSGWILALGLAVLAFVGAIVVFRLPRKAWEALAAALVLGLGGYAIQGAPGLAGAPKSHDEDQADKSDIAAVQRQLAKAEVPAGDKRMIIANAFVRNGQFADAAEVLRGSVEANPRNADAWLAMANALVGHAEGNLSPAALFAYGRAAQAAPNHPGPPFFLGMALAQSGRLEQARSIWGNLLARAPRDAAWRGDLEQRLAALDRFIAAQNGNGTAR